MGVLKRIPATFWTDAGNQAPSRERSSAGGMGQVIDLASITELPVGAAPIVLWFGDETALGNGARSTITDPRYPGADPDVDPQPLSYGPAFAWNRNARLDATWDNAERLERATNVLDAWEQMHDRGGHNAADLGIPSDVADTWEVGPEFGLAHGLRGIFRDRESNELPVYVLKCARATSSLGPISNEASHWSPFTDADQDAQATNSQFTLLTEYYLRPAIAALLAEGKRPFIVGVFASIGTADGTGDTQAGAVYAGLQDRISHNMAVFRGELERFLGIGPLGMAWARTWDPKTTLREDVAAVRSGQDVHATEDRLDTVIVEGAGGPVDTGDPSGLTAEGSWRLGQAMASKWREFVSARSRGRELDRLLAWELTEAP